MDLADPQLQRLRALWLELEAVRARLAETPKPTEAWRRRARIASELAALARQEVARRLMDGQPPTSFKYRRRSASGPRTPR